MYDALTIRLTCASDWQQLKQVRLAALLDAPTAFAVSHRTAAAYTDAQWQQRAASTSTAFWLALRNGHALGMVGATLDDAGRYNLIAMWVEPAARGNGVAERLVKAVKAQAREHGHGRVYLDVAPENTQAAQFYLKQGFTFIDEFEALESHPHITLQSMVWMA